MSSRSNDLASPSHSVTVDSDTPTDAVSIATDDDAKGASARGAADEKPSRLESINAMLTNICTVVLFGMVAVYVCPNMWLRYHGPTYLPEYFEQPEAASGTSSSAAPATASEEMKETSMYLVTKALLNFAEGRDGWVHDRIFDNKFMHRLGYGKEHEAHKESVAVVRVVAAIAAVLLINDTVLFSLWKWVHKRWRQRKAAGKRGAAAAAVEEGAGSHAE